MTEIRFDDRVAIIGSANINDRSMNGARDSEMCAVIEDVRFLHSGPSGAGRFRSGVFSHSLRMRCFAEHLGFDPSSAEDWRTLTSRCDRPQWK